VCLIIQIRDLCQLFLRQRQRQNNGHIFRIFRPCFGRLIDHYVIFSLFCFYLNDLDPIPEASVYQVLNGILIAIIQIVRYLGHLPLALTERQRHDHRIFFYLGPGHRLLTEDLPGRIYFAEGLLRRIREYDIQTVFRYFTLRLLQCLALKVRNIIDSWFGMPG